VLRELEKIGFSDMRRFAKWGPGGVSLLSSEGLSDEDAACISEVSESTSKDGGSIRFKLHDKKASLELLGKHLKLFTEKHEHSGPDGKPIEFNSLTDEQLDAKLSALLEKVPKEKK
jgi:phage terminase small subunit